MSLRALTITHADTQWHGAFARFVSQIFPEIGFERWIEYGGWDERYVACALADGKRLVANLSLTRMELIVSGQRMRGWQLGAVGTEPELRGRGLQRQLMRHMFLAVQPDDVVFLFANDEVLGFYPRFGFEPVREATFEAAELVEPSGEPLRTLSMSLPDDRALLQRIAATAAPVTERFGAERYGPIVLWYACNFYADGLRYDLDADAIFVVEQRADTLRVHDVLAASALELQAYLPRLIAAPVSRVELGFTGDRCSLAARSGAPYTQGQLFVHRQRPLQLAEPFRFPLLAQT
jgi:predicted N-acetyltransferase YhbS